MKFPAFWTKSPSPPAVEITPPWYLIWGEDYQLSKETISCDRTLATAHIQPVRSPEGRFLVVGDIWLTNRSQLLHQLEYDTIEELPIQPGTDAQIVAALWESWGVESLLSVQGMFSFAVWDFFRKELWLARDRIGFRTMYYTITGKTRWIAPRLRTLAPYNSADLDFVALRDYLSCGFVPGERTLWRNVRELRPGTVLRFFDEPQRGKSEVKVYWQLQEQIQDTDQPLKWYGKKVRTLLEQVVQEYLPAGEPVGTYLSGGLGSSCITALAAKLHDYPVHTYSMHFGASSPNELEFANLVAKHCRTQHHILEITPAQMWEHLLLTMSQLDDPIGDPLTVSHYLLGQLAKEAVKVILNGEGADPCFGISKNQPMLLNHLLSSAATFQPELLSAYLNSFQKCTLDLPQLLKPHIWETVKLEPSVFTSDLPSAGEYPNQLMTLNVKFKGADHTLTQVSNLTRSAGLEGRSPLFDRRIVQQAMRIPSEYKLAGANEKAALKQAVADLLPLEILQHPQSGMMVPVHSWFRRLWQPQARALLLNRKAAIAPYLNQQLIRDWLDYRRDTWNRYGVKLWLLTSLEIWLQVNRK